MRGSRERSVEKEKFADTRGAGTRVKFDFPRLPCRSILVTRRKTNLCGPDPMEFAVDDGRRRLLQIFQRRGELEISRGLCRPFIYFFHFIFLRRIPQGLVMVPYSEGVSPAIPIMYSHSYYSH